MVRSRGPPSRCHIEALKLEEWVLERSRANMVYHHLAVLSKLKTPQKRVTTKNPSRTYSLNSSLTKIFRKYDLIQRQGKFYTLSPLGFEIVEKVEAGEL